MYQELEEILSVSFSKNKSHFELFQENIYSNGIIMRSNILVTVGVEKTEQQWSERNFLHLTL